MNNYNKRIFGILIDRLAENTENRKIFWHRKVGESGLITFTPTFNTFYDETRTALESKDIALTLNLNQPDTLPMTLEFTTEAGLIDTIEITLNEKDLWDSMLSLFGLALKSSKYVDASINEMLEYLNKL